MTPEFAKSQIGNKFLTNDIPQLVVALNKLTEAMTESNKIEEKKAQVITKVKVKYMFIRVPVLISFEAAIGCFF